MCGFGWAYDSTAQMWNISQHFWQATKTNTVSNACIFFFCLSLMPVLWPRFTLQPAPYGIRRSNEKVQSIQHHNEYATKCGKRKCIFFHCAVAAQKSTNCSWNRRILFFSCELLSAKWALVLYESKPFLHSFVLFFPSWATRKWIISMDFRLSLLTSSRIRFPSIEIIQGDWPSHMHSWCGRAAQHLKITAHFPLARLQFRKWQLASHTRRNRTIPTRKWHRTLDSISRQGKNAMQHSFEIDCGGWQN